MLDEDADALSRLHVPDVSTPLLEVLHGVKCVPEARLARDDCLCALPTPGQALEILVGTAAELWASLQQ